LSGLSISFYTTAAARDSGLMQSVDFSGEKKAKEIGRRATRESASEANNKQIEMRMF
jgi:hypothetical protein